MTRGFVLGISTLVAVFLLGCDQAGELAEPETAGTDQHTAAAKIRKKCGCWDVEATLTTLVDFDAFTATGTIKGDLKGTVTFTGDPSALTQISSDAFPPLNPATFSFTGQLDITTKKGTFTTRGVGVFEGGPASVAAEFHHIVAGTGVFADATGTLYFNIAATEEANQYVEQMHGEICTPCEDGKDDGDED